VPSVLIVLSIVILAGTLLYAAIVPTPSVAGLARGRTARLQEMTRETKDAKARAEAARHNIAPMVWSGDTDTISGAVLEQLTAQARQRGLSISAFRPQRTQDVGGVTELPYTVQLTGAYPGVHAVMESLDAPDSKIVLRSAEIASSAAGSGVTATLGLTVYVVSDATIGPSAQSTPRKAVAHA
jgi:Tfp pilus assembly protein PilO